MKASNYISLVLLISLFTACHKADIPIELTDNEEAVEYINDLDKTVTKFNKLVIDLAKITGGKDINNTDSLSTGQKLRLAKAAGQFMIVSKKIEALMDSRSAIESTLSGSELSIFSNKCDEIESNFGTIDVSELDMDEVQMAEFKQKFEEHQAYNKAKRAHNDSIQAQYNEQKSKVNPYEYNKEGWKEVKDENRWKVFTAMGIGFLIFIALTTVAIVKVIQIIKNIR